MQGQAPKCYIAHEKNAVRSNLLNKSLRFSRFSFFFQCCNSLSEEEMKKILQSFAGRSSSSTSAMRERVCLKGLERHIKKLVTKREFFCCSFDGIVQSFTSSGRHNKAQSIYETKSPSFLSSPFSGLKFNCLSESFLFMTFSLRRIHFNPTQMACLPYVKSGIYHTEMKF